MKKSLHIRYIPLTLCAVLIFLLYRYGSSSPVNLSEEGTVHGVSFNLVFYSASALVVLAVYIVTSFLTEFLRRKEVSLEKEDLAAPIRNSLLVLGFFFMAVALYYLYKVYVSETLIYPEESMTTYIRQIVPHIPFFLFIFAGSLITFFSLESTRSKKAARTGGACLFAAFNAILLYCPNPLEDAGGAAIYHIHAYTNSIINAAHLVPYDEYNTSIYGHYGILYLPLVKLFGNHYRAVAISLSLFGFLAFFASFKAIGNILQSDFIFYLSMTAATATTTVLNRRGQYYQTNPHRLLFPGLLLLLITWEESGKRMENIRRRYTLEWIFGSLAILWNLETGVLCILVLMAVRIFQSMKKHPLFSIATGKTLLLDLPLLPASFLGAWTITGIYNCLTGGGFNNFKSFLFPLLSSSFMIDTLRMPLPGALAFYVLVIIVAALSCLECLRMRTTRMAVDSASVTLGFTVSLSCLACMVYFINRPAFANIAVCVVQFSLLLGLICDRVFSLHPEEKRDMLHSSVNSLLIEGAFLAYFILGFLSVSSILEVPSALSYRAGIVWENPSMKTMEAEMAARIPRDTFAYGIGIPEVYQDMGWETGYYGIDFSDINSVNRKKIEASLADSSAVVTTDNDFDAENWDLAAEWPCRTVTFRYFVRKPAQS